jgi:sterol desaturase/sphingolipid hydroxylase (fatty acid hydroxylase superfamily)
MMRPAIDLWVGVQTWLFETFVSPVLFSLNLMEWFEPAFNAVEFFMLGVVQILVILLVMRLLERRWGVERGEERLIGVDRVYTLLNKLGVIPLLVFVLAYPITNQIEHLVRVLGFTPPRLERLVPGLYDNAFLSFLVYFALYDFAAYWVHRAQHRFAWWWALHSLHHSQRRVTVWTDDRNHVLDDLLVNLVLAVFAQFVGVQPDDFVLILMVGRMIESWSHANVDMSFGRLGERLLVGPRFHRLHHARADAAEPHIHDHNFAPVLPVWDMIFGTARFGDAPRPTGVDDPRVDADNGRGWLGQQVAVFKRFAAALMPRRSWAAQRR